MIKRMALGFIPILTVQDMKVGGRMTKEREWGFIPILTAGNMRGAGRVENPTGMGFSPVGTGNMSGNSRMAEEMVGGF